MLTSRGRIPWLVVALLPTRPVLAPLRQLPADPNMTLPSCGLRPWLVVAPPWLLLAKLVRRMGAVRPLATRAGPPPPPCGAPSRSAHTVLLEPGWLAAWGRVLVSRVITRLVLTVWPRRDLARPAPPLIGSLPATYPARLPRKS